MKSKFKVIVIAATVIFSIAATGVSSNLFEISKNIDIFTTIYRELNTYYVDDIEPNKLMRTGIDAMLETLDPYTNFISEAELENHRFQITGKYGGIGAIIRKVNDNVVIIEPYQDFAAYNAGLRAGDKIVKIDGKPAADKTSDEISKILRGTPGTKVDLEINRPFVTDNLPIELVRQEIKIENVPYSGMVNDNIGFIKLTQFTDKAGKNVSDALVSLKAAHPELSGVILDLRGNPGGLLREAVNVSNVFINKGEEVVSTRGKVSEWEKTFRALNEPVDESIPLVVLIDRGSASASEIVSGVMQDLDRGIIIGQNTFGKGLVQSTRDVSYKTKLKITTAKYYIPSGRCIQAINYSGRNEDGSVGKIPDSLKTEFSTRNGRTVYDGGGIYPDINVELDPLGHITKSLLSKYHIFDFATEYCHNNEKIGDAKTFSITEQDFESFTNFLVDKEYAYSTNSEDLLASLEESTKDEKYYDAISSELDVLKQSITHDKQKDLFKYKSEIIEMINREIVARYYYQKGKIEIDFNVDPEVKEAITILNDKTKYQSHLDKQ